MSGAADRAERLRQGAAALGVVTTLCVGYGLAD